MESLFLDRMLNYSNVMNIDGESYSLKDMSKKALPTEKRGENNN